MFRPFALLSATYFTGPLLLTEPTPLEVGPIVVVSEKSHHPSRPEIVRGLKTPEALGRNRRGLMGMVRLYRRDVGSVYRLCQLLDLTRPPEIRRDQGVSLGYRQRQYGIATPQAVRADRGAEQEFERVPHGDLHTRYARHNVCMISQKR
jgi:hypothetical protein